MDIKNIKDEKTGEMYDVFDLEDGYYDVIRQSDGKTYRASLLSCSCTGFKYRHTCKHHRWIFDNEKTLYKKDYDWKTAQSLYEDLLVDLSKVIDLMPSTDKIACGGSLARKQERVRDIDMILATDDTEMIEKLISNTSKIFSHVIVASHHIVRGIYCSGRNEIQIDIHICPENGFEAYKLFLSGNLWFTIKMRKKASELKLKLTEQGLFKWDEVKKDHSIFVTNKELEIFEKLGMDYVPIEKRLLTEENWKN